MMFIGDLKMKYGLMLAPMAGVTDRSFRKICREFGAEYAVSEMISAKAIYYMDKKTDSLACFENFERPIGLQLFGSEPEIMAFAADKLVRDYSPEVIDINMGCPVHKIVGNGEGSSLMKNPALASDIVKAVKKSVCNAAGYDYPVTVKIRTGYDRDHKNAVEFALTLQEAGADAVCVHGRTREQMYAPPVDLDTIAHVKDALNIPVIGNGGIYSAEDALHMFEYTGCDGIMLGQGVCGNPWLFEEIIAALSKSEYIAPKKIDRINMAKRHTRMLIEDKGDYTGIREARKHLSWYLNGFREAAVTRDRINRAEDIETVFKLLDNVLEYQLDN